MNQRLKRSVIALLGAGVLFGVGACSVIAPPDEVGLYYMEGQSDGYKFGHCIEPGVSDKPEWNNSVVWLPNNLRTWNIAATGGDSNVPITVAAKPEVNQPSGVQVNVWTQTNFKLNTSCVGGKDSPLVKWWETQGRRYQANTEAGWNTMLNNTIVTALITSTRNVVREYSADILVSGVSNAEVQQKIADAFQPELKRLLGGDFFCGPTFDRKSGNCTPVEVILKDVDYTDPGIQEARNAKVKALENAAAQVAEAEGKLKAAKAQEALYNNPAWLELELANRQLEAIKACSANPNCTIIIGSNGNVLLNQNK